jgi:hypothetical protein
VEYQPSYEKGERYMTQLISMSHDKKKAEIVVKQNNKSVTKHVVLGEDGKYHHNGDTYTL